MTWHAWLDGHDFDFQALAEIFGQDDDPAVHRPAPNQCYVTATTIGFPPDPPDHEVALTCVQRLNGTARALDSGFRPVTLSGRYTGQGGATVVLTAESLEARSRLSVLAVANGAPPATAAPRKGPRYVALARSDSDVADALHVLGQPTKHLDWYDLFKVLEIVRDAAGGTGTITTSGWVTSAELSRFTASANHPGWSGAAARHARQVGPSPSRGLSLEEGHQLVRRLVVAWVESRPDW